MVLDSIKSDIVAAMKAHDQAKVDCLRYVVGEIKKLGIDKYPPSSGGSLTEEDVMSVMKSQVKKHKESIEMFEKGGRKDLVEAETDQLKIIESYLPEQMGEEELRNKINDLRKANPDLDFGGMMKVCMAELKDLAEGKVVAAILKDILN